MTMPERIPLPPPIDGENASYCLEVLVAADNEAWAALQNDWNNATTDAQRAADETAEQDAEEAWWRERADFEDMGSDD